MIAWSPRVATWLLLPWNEDREIHRSLAGQTSPFSSHRFAWILFVSFSFIIRCQFDGFFIRLLDVKTSGKLRLKRNKTLLEHLHRKLHLIWFCFSSTKHKPNSHRLDFRGYSVNTKQRLIHLQLFDIWYFYAYF